VYDDFARDYPSWWKVIKRPRSHAVQPIDSGGGEDRPSVVRQVRQILATLRFHRVRFCVRLLTNSAIFMTFGVLFPPLAVVIMFAICVQTYELQRKISYLYVLRDGDSKVIKSVLLKEELNKQLTIKFHRTADIFSGLLWMLFPLVSSFYAFFVFDTLGDQVGFRRAMWAPVVTTVLVYVCMLYFMYHRK
jgi:hypothetical protein